CRVESARSSESGGSPSALNIMVPLPIRRQAEAGQGVRRVRDWVVAFSRRRVTVYDRPQRPPTTPPPGMTLRVHPSRIDLAREFKANIYGRHSGDLQRILNAFRSEPQDGQYVLIREGRQGPWALAAYDPRPGQIPRRLGPVYASTAEAEWAVFKLRWKRFTGQDLPL